MRSISVKLSLLYIFLAVLNITFFTIITFENQIDLIAHITEYETKELADQIYVELDTLLEEIKQKGEITTTLQLVDLLKDHFADNIEDLVFFTEQGEVLSQTDPEFEITPEQLTNARRAFANNEFVKQFYLPQIIDEKREILFYVPISTNIDGVAEFIMLFKLKIEDIDKRLNTLYRLIIIFIFVIALFHILFGFILHRLIIVPLKVLTTRSMELSRGNYGARVLIRSNDEIGSLSQSFNTMATSIEETITQLNRKNAIMQKELQMAARVQQSIYPDLRRTPFFDIAVYHRPFFEVSGDYHNVIPLDKNRYGIIVADVAGHGVSAALITMLIKNQFEGIAPKYIDSKELMEYINKAFDNLMTDFDKFFTAFYLIIDANKVVTFSNAAHPRAFVLRPGARGFKVLDTEGVFIGLPAIIPREFNSKSIRLRSGDKIVLYTDGITEALNAYHKEYSSDRLHKVARDHVGHPCDIMLQKILDDFHEFCEPENRKDDETLIIIEIKDTDQEGI